MFNRLIFLMQPHSIWNSLAFFVFKLNYSANPFHLPPPNISKAVGSHKTESRLHPPIRYLRQTSYFKHKNVHMYFWPKRLLCYQSVWSNVCELFYPVFPGAFGLVIFGANTHSFSRGLHAPCDVLCKWILKFNVFPDGNDGAIWIDVGLRVFWKPKSSFWADLGIVYK